MRCLYLVITLVLTTCCLLVAQAPLDKGDYVPNFIEISISPRPGVVPAGKPIPQWTNYKNSIQKT